jgi:hypothetical protein
LRPDCFERFRGISEDLRDIKELSSRTLKVLIGNGGPGVIQRVATLEERARLRDREEDRRDLRGQASEPQQAHPMKRAVTEMPPWGWLIAALIGAKIGWSGVVEIVNLLKAIIGGVG